MTLSPKKYVSNFTSSTTHRGVEAKEVEIANTRLDMDVSNSTQVPVESSSGSLAEDTAEGAQSQAMTAPTADHTGSYLQVVVQKHRSRGKREPTAVAGAGAAGPSDVGAAPDAHARLPTASTPIAHTIPGGAGGAGQWGAGADVVVLPHPLLLSYPTGQLYYTGQRAGGDAPAPRALLDAARTVLAINDDKGKTKVAEGKCVQKKSQRTAQTTNKAWKIFGDCDPGYSFDNEPECVEVYYFEQGGGEFLATSGGAGAGGRASRLERVLGRAGVCSCGAALAREALAAPRLLAAAPVALLLQVQRCALTVVRGAVAGAVQTASDYALKPALALAYNAVARPVLVFVAHLLGGVRLALQPLAGAACDAVEPAARLLAAARLVDVRVSHHPHPHPHPHPPPTTSCQCHPCRPYGTTCPS